MEWEDRFQHPLCHRLARVAMSEEERNNLTEYPEELKGSGEKLRSKTMGLTGQNRTRHPAILSQKSCQHETRQRMALNVAMYFNQGKRFSEKPVSWEISWRRDCTISEQKTTVFPEDKNRGLWMRE